MYENIPLLESTSNRRVNSGRTRLIFAHITRSRIIIYNKSMYIIYRNYGNYTWKVGVSSNYAPHRRSSVISLISRVKSAENRCVFRHFLPGIYVVYLRWIQGIYADNPRNAAELPTISLQRAHNYLSIS